MTDVNSDYAHLASRLSGLGVDLDAVERRLGALEIETPSWGYARLGDPLRDLPAARPPA